MGDCIYELAFFICKVVPVHNALTETAFCLTVEIFEHMCSDSLIKVSLILYQTFNYIEH